MGFTGFERSNFVLHFRRCVREYAKAEGREMQYEVAEVEIFVYRAYGASGPRSYDPDINRISHDDRTFGDGWGINVEHHDSNTAAALGRHIMFISDAHLAQDQDLELGATAQAICAFAAGRITHSPKQLFSDSRPGSTA